SRSWLFIARAPYAASPARRAWMRPDAPAAAKHQGPAGAAVPAGSDAGGRHRESRGGRKRGSGTWLRLEVWAGTPEPELSARARAGDVKRGQARAAAVATGTGPAFTRNGTGTESDACAA